MSPRTATVRPARDERGGVRPAPSTINNSQSAKLQHPHQLTDNTGMGRWNHSALARCLRQCRGRTLLRLGGLAAGCLGIGLLAGATGVDDIVAAPAPPIRLTNEPIGDRATHDLPTLRRVVRHFDFEEAETAPYEMPLNFYRFGGDAGAAAQGFPPFGRMQLTDEAAWSGRWSFGFELDGGSLAARIPTAVIPAVPLADYQVTARVRTLGLRHARARLVAWLHDHQGKVIDGSRAVSRLVATNGAWEILAVDVPGNSHAASDLVLELQLLQPRQFLPDGAPPEQLLLEDVSGRAWFDDVTVWHLPRIDLAADEAAAPHDAPSMPSVSVLIRDLARQDLNATLRVYDLDGREVFEQTFPAPRMPRPRIVKPNLPAYGWYRAVLDVHNGDELTARSSIDLVAMSPKISRRTSEQVDRFGVVLNERWYDQAAAIPALVDELGVGVAVLPVLDRTMDERNHDETATLIKGGIDALRADHRRLILSLESVPTLLGRQFDLAETDMLDLLQLPPEAWRGFVHDLLVNYAFEVDQWQIGTTGAGAAFWQSNLGEKFARSRANLSAYIPNPAFFVPFSAEQRPKPGLGEHGVTLSIPHELPSESIGEILGEWAATVNDLIILLELPPHDRYAPRQRVTDLAFRTLEAWRAEAGTLAIRAPWRWNTSQSGAANPDPIYPVWRQLARQLSGRRFVGELALGHNLHCWILQGDDPADAALVAWCEGVGCEAVSDIQLAEGPVQVTDIFGNEHTEPLSRHGHYVRLSELPVFIEDINVGLVRFRGGFTLEPSFIPAEHRLHEHQIVLRNPWDIAISGTIRLPEWRHDEESPGWHISPRSLDFAIAPKDEVRLPVQILVDRSVLAGPRRLDATIHLQADAPYQLVMHTDIKIGLRDIDVSSSWRVARNVETGEDDLIVTLYVTNKGTRTMNLDAFLMAPDVRQQRRMISGLQPREMAIRMFQVEQGAALLSGQRIRVGVTERDGVARLTEELDIPHVARDSRAVTEADDESP